MDDEEMSPLLCIHFDPDVISLRHIKHIARQTGAKLQDTFGHLLVEVSGIRHPRHARSITRRLEKIAGMVDAYAGATGWIRLELDRKSTRLNSSHVAISYAVFCLKKKKTKKTL